MLCPAIVSLHPPLPAFLTCYNTRRGVALLQDAVLSDIATTEQLIHCVNGILRTYLQYLPPMVHTQHAVISCIPCKYCTPGAVSSVALMYFFVLAVTSPAQQLPVVSPGFLTLGHLAHTTAAGNTEQWMGHRADTDTYILLL